MLFISYILNDQEHHTMILVVIIYSKVMATNMNKKLLTTPITEGSQPLYKARGPSSRSTVDRAWNIPLYRYGEFCVCKYKTHEKVKH